MGLGVPHRGLRNAVNTEGDGKRGSKLTSYDTIGKGTWVCEATLGSLVLFIHGDVGD